MFFQRMYCSFMASFYISQASWRHAKAVIEFVAMTFVEVKLMF